MDYTEAIDYINNRKWFGGGAGLERMRMLMEKLGDPQKELRFVHIAGTNGKGSCAAMLASMLKAAGYRTGLFTSPYLSRFNERMQINGKQIDDAALAEIVTGMKSAADGMEEHPNVFEMVTAAAMLWYRQEKCDIVVLETGLGGRLDATNIIERPEAAVIMNIGLDHTERLGDTIGKIAAEKAGIIKPGCDVVLYEQGAEATETVRARCEAIGAKLCIPAFSGIARDFDSLYGQSFSYRGESYAIPLLGNCQLKNAATALETVEVLREKGWKLEQGDVEHGLYAVSWPGRFELIRDEPYFVVDGGHNPQCAQTVVENIGQYFPNARHVMLIGVLADKDYKNMLKILNFKADEYVCITPPSPRALQAEELAKELQRFGKPVTVCASIEEGVAAASDAAGAQGVVCAVGSLYSVGPIRACFGQQ